jgi:hypothetical protein
VIHKVPIINEIYQHKDGGLYEVVKVVDDYVLSNGVVIKLVEYKTLDNDTVYVRRLEHFNNSFKKYNKEEE